MDSLIAMAFGAGAAGFAYTKLGRRVGYGDQKSVFTIVATVFVITSLVFYTIIRFVVPSK